MCKYPFVWLVDLSVHQYLTLVPCDRNSSDSFLSTQDFRGNSNTLFKMTESL